MRVLNAIVLLAAVGLQAPPASAGGDRQGSDAFAHPLELSWFVASEQDFPEMGLLVTGAADYEQILVVVGTRQIKPVAIHGADLIVEPALVLRFEGRDDYGGRFLPIPKAVLELGPFFVQAFATDPDGKRGFPLRESNLVELDASLAAVDPSWESIRASLEVELDAADADTCGMRHGLSIRIQTPTGGYALRAERVTRDATSTRVFVTLVEPERGSANLSMIEHHSLAVDLGEGELGHVRLYLGRKTRGDRETLPPITELVSEL